MNLAVKRLLTWQQENEESSDFKIGENYLLVIGIDHYDDCPGLNNAVNDAKALARVLLDKYQFEDKDGRFRELYDDQVTWANIDTALARLANDVKASDSVVIFFAGHGHYEKPTKAGFWVPAEAKYGQVSGYYSYDRLLRRIKGIEAQHIFLIVDSCYSGVILDREVKYSDDDKDFWVPSRWILASGRNEVVSDGEKGENSPFSTMLINVLKRAANEGISVIELAGEVTTIVKRNEDQTPIGRPLKGVGDQNGQFIFLPKRNLEQDWKETEDKGTTQAYLDFLQKYGESIYSDEAYWKIALTINTIDSFRDYRTNFPKGEYYNLALDKQLHLEEKDKYENAKEDGEASLSDFLRKYPNSVFAKEAKKVRQHLLRSYKEPKEWKRVRKQNTIEAYQNFIDEFEDGEYVEKAGKKLAYLEKVEEKRKAESELSTVFKNADDAFDEENFELALYYIETYIQKAEESNLESKDKRKVLDLKQRIQKIKKKQEKWTLKNPVLLFSSIGIVFSFLIFWKFAEWEWLKIEKKKDLVETKKIIKPEKPTLIHMSQQVFLMGDIFREGDNNETPSRLTELSDFEISPTELSIREFAEFVQATGYKTAAEIDGGSLVWNASKWDRKSEANWRYDPFGELRLPSEYNHPVIHINWYDAIKYCNWLSKAHGYEAAYIFREETVEEKREANGYRLPHEAEWEFAARQLGETVRFGNGDSIADPDSLNFNGRSADYDFIKVGTFRRNTVEVDSIPGSKNSQGLFHMSGNVSEWCWDRYQPYQSGSGTEELDGSGVNGPRVVRGGAWISSGYFIRASARDRLLPDKRTGYVGFRLARTP